MVVPKTPHGHRRQWDPSKPVADRCPTLADLPQHQVASLRKSAKPHRPGQAIIVIASSELHCCKKDLGPRR